MLKPKQWLVQNGHMPAGSENRRGRLSREHIALITAAVASGAAIEGYSAVPVVEKPAPATRKPVVESARVFDMPDIARDERTTEAYRFEDGKAVSIGMRTVDNVCGNSLTYCRCEQPRVWVDHTREAMVLFKPLVRTTKGK